MSFEGLRKALGEEWREQGDGRLRDYYYKPDERLYVWWTKPDGSQYEVSFDTDRQALLLGRVPGSVSGSISRGKAFTSVTEAKAAALKWYYGELQVTLRELNLAP